LLQIQGQLLEKRITAQEKPCFHESYTYDILGNQTSITTCAGTSHTHYNNRKEPTTHIDPLGNTTHITTTYVGGLVKTTTDPKGIQTQIHYDFAKRPLSKEVSYLGQTIQKEDKTYDPAGNLVELTHTPYEGTLPKEPITHKWTYGPKGRQEKFIEAGQKETLHTYDSYGRLQTIIKPDKSPIHHTYDNLSRLSRYFGQGIDYHYTYDAKNRLIKVTDKIQNTTLERSYDPLGHLIQEKLANGLSIRNSYNAQGQRTTLHLPDQTTATFTYKGPYLHTVTRNQWTGTYAERNLAGKPTHLILPDKTPIHLTYDPCLRRQQIDSPPYKATYSYDTVGNLVDYAYQDPLGAQTHHYTYDPLNQLIDDNGFSYEYNSLYNRIGKGRFPYALNTLNQITHDGYKEYSYDLNGNLIHDGLITYEYDLLDRLIASTLDGTRTTYTYDAFNRRIAKNKDLFIWDGQNEIGLYRGKIRELRILGEGLGAEIGASLILELNQTPYFPIHDQTGSPVVLLDRYSNPTTYRYSPFGESSPSRLTPSGTFAEVCSPWSFASKRYDVESGFIYFGRRYYAPTLGRWVTPDPQGFKDGPNLYAYLHNCPLTHIDPYGLFGERVGRGCSFISNLAFRSIEWIGANLFPVPHLCNVIESIGRWGSGGGWSEPSRYRTPHNEVIPIPGTVTAGHTFTYTNGMCAMRNAAVEQGQHVSKSCKGAHVDLLYHGTNGLLWDTIGSMISKLGIPTPFNRMCADYYTDKLKDDPKHIFTSFAHSRGGIQMMNNARLMRPDVSREHIDVVAYGTATLIPKGIFRSAENIISKIDPIPMTNPIRYGIGLFSDRYDITYLSPKTYSPLKEHSFLGETYAEDMMKRGGELANEYAIQ